LIVRTPDESTPAFNTIHQSTLLQNINRLARGADRHLEALYKLPFGRKTTIRGILSVQDCTFKRCDNFLHIPTISKLLF